MSAPCSRTLGATPKAASSSRSDHHLARAKDALARGEEVAFDVSRGEHIRIAARRLTLRPDERRPVHVPREALSSIDMRDDLLVLSVRTGGTEALDPSSEDHLYDLAYQAGERTEEHRFRTSEIPNLRLLWLLLDERLAEVPPDSEPR